jgi:hypothetical protein
MRVSRCDSEQADELSATNDNKQIYEIQCKGICAFHILAGTAYVMRLPQKYGDSVRISDST